MTIDQTAYLKEGDEVMVRAKVVNVCCGELELRVQAPGISTRFWAGAKDVEVDNTPSTNVT